MCTLCPPEAEMDQNQSGVQPFLAKFDYRTISPYMHHMSGMARMPLM